MKSLSDSDKIEIGTRVWHKNNPHISGQIAYIVDPSVGQGMCVLWNSSIPHFLSLERAADLCVENYKLIKHPITAEEITNSYAAEIFNDIYTRLDKLEHEKS